MPSAQIPSPSAPQAENDMTALEKFAAERGAEAGLHEIPAAEFDSVVASRLALLASRTLGEPDSSRAAIERRRQMSERRRAEAEVAIEAYRSKREAASKVERPRSQLVRASAGIAILCALGGLALEASGAVLSIRGWLALGLIAAFLALNLQSVPKWVRQAGEYSRYLMTLAAHRNARKQLAEVEQAEIENLERDRRRERWIGERIDLLRAVFREQQARAQRAASRRPALEAVA